MRVCSTSPCWCSSDEQPKQGGEPAWFAQEMTRVLSPIREDLAELNEKAARLTTDLNALTDKVTGLDNRLKTVQSSNAQIHQIAAIVGSHYLPLLVVH